MDDIKPKKQVNEKFSGMINALSYGAPPHGGIAPGIDRIVMLLANQINIREVTLFPLNQNAEDLLMEAPSEATDKQLKSLNPANSPSRLLIKFALKTEHTKQVLVVLQSSSISSLR